MEIFSQKQFLWFTSAIKPDLPLAALLDLQHEKTSVICNYSSLGKEEALLLGRLVDKVTIDLVQLKLINVLRAAGF